MNALRDLVEKATPGPWFHLHETGMDDSDINTVYRRATLPEQVEADHSLLGKSVAGPPIWKNEDAALIALAPDIALLCADMGEALRKYAVGESTFVSFQDADALLARLTALEERFGGGVA